MNKYEKDTRWAHMIEDTPCHVCRWITYCAFITRVYPQIPIYHVKAFSDVVKKEELLYLKNANAASCAGRIRLGFAIHLHTIFSSMPAPLVIEMGDAKAHIDKCSRRSLRNIEYRIACVTANRMLNILEDDDAMMIDNPISEKRELNPIQVLSLTRLSKIKAEAYTNLEKFNTSGFG